MAELILRPNGEGEINQHLQLPASGAHWQKVDEVVANDDADYVYGASGSGTYDLYTIEPHGLPLGTVIEKVTLYGRFYRGQHTYGHNAVADFYIKTQEASHTLVTDYTYDTWYTDSHEFLLNPTSGLPWTLDDLTNLQIGTGLSYATAPSVENEGRNSQLYIVVTYAAPVIVAPTVTTDPATGVTTITATLNGTLDNDGGEICACGFEYGIFPNFTHTTPIQHKTTGQTFAQALSELLPNTTYQFRALATNSAGTSYGATRTFTTVAIVLPTVITDPATDINATSATINSTLDNDGGEACDCGFEWGETIAYGNTTPTQSRTTGQTESQIIIGLNRNTLHHFRAFATNSEGTSYGVDRTFTTLVGNPAITTPLVTTNPATGII